MQTKGGSAIHMDRTTTETVDPKTGEVKKVIQEKSTTVQQPNNAESPAQIFSDGKKTEATTGNPQKHDFVTEGIAETTTWAGIAFIAAGTLIAIFAGYIPFLSAVDGIWIALAGVGIIFIPIFLQKYAIWFIIGGIVVLAIWMIFKQNKIAWFKKATGPEAQAERLAVGDARAAGALAYVYSGGKGIENARMISAMAPKPIIVPQVFSVQSNGMNYIANPQYAPRSFQNARAFA